MAKKPPLKPRKIEKKIPPKRGLTAQQEMFIQEYLIDLNATQAAVRAGYSEKSAREIGCENLTKPAIRQKIRTVIDARLKKLEIKGEQILQSVAEIAYVDPAEMFDEAGELKSIDLMPPHVRRAIASFDMAAGKVKLWNKNHAQDLLGKNQKLWFEMIEHSGTIGLAERLAKARAKKKGKK